MKAQTKQLYEEAHELHLKALAILAVLDRPTSDQEENADTIYVLKKTAELLKETRAAVNRKHDLFNAIAVSLAAEEGELTVRTEWCTMTCSTKVSTQVPTLAKTPQAYEVFCKEVLGITSEEVIESGMVSIHYERWSEFYTAMLQAGKDIPPLLARELKQYDASKTIVRKKRDLLETL